MYRLLSLLLWGDASRHAQVRAALRNHVRRIASASNFAGDACAPCTADGGHWGCVRCVLALEAFASATYMPVLAVGPTGPRRFGFPAAGADPERVYVVAWLGEGDTAAPQDQCWAVLVEEADAVALDMRRLDEVAAGSQRRNPRTRRQPRGGVAA